MKKKIVTFAVLVLMAAASPVLACEGQQAAVSKGQVADNVSHSSDAK